MAVAYELLVRLAAEIRDYKAGLREAVSSTKDATKDIGNATDQVGAAQGRLGASLSNQARQLVTNAAAYSTSSVAAAALGATLVALAAGAAGVVYAQVKGYQENQAYSTAITLTGNAAGVTTGKLQLMAQRLDAVVGTQATAAAGLVEFVKAGAGGAENLERITRAALQWESVTGTAVGKVAEMFAKLRDKPLQASLELNASMNYLTVSTYEQIRALEEQGKTTEAATLAQNTFADALESRKAEIHSNLGTIEKLWRGIGKAISEVIDGALNIGRVAGTDAQLAAARKAADALDQQIASRRDRGLASGDLDPRLAAAQQLVASLQEQVKLESRSAEFRADEANRVKATVEYNKITGKLLSDQDKTLREIQVLREKGRDLGYDEARIQADIDKLLASKAKKNKDGVSSYLTIRDELAKTAALTAGELEKGRALTEAEKFRVGIVEKINSEKSKLTESEKQSLLVLLDQVEADQKRRDSQRQAIALDQQLYALSVKQEEEIAQARVAADQHVYAIQRQITEYALGIDEAIELTRFELSLGGQSERQRAIALEQYRIERDLKLQIRAIDENKGLDQAGRDAQILKAKAAAELAKAGAVDKVVLDEWKRTSSIIETSLTDALLRGFESGKGFLQNLVDTAKNLFSTLVLRPIISAVVQPIAASVTGALQVGQAAAGGGGGLGNLLNIGTNLSSAYNAFTGGLTSTLQSFGTSITQGFTSIGFDGAATAVANFTNSISAGVGQLAAAAPYALAAVAVLNALGVFRSKKIVDGGLQGELGGQINDYALQRKGGTLFSGPSYSVLDRGVSAQNQALQDTYNTIRDTVAGMAEQLGIGNEAIKSFTVQLGNDLIHPDTGGFGIKTQGLSQDEIIAKIEAALIRANDQLAEFALGTEEFDRNGESATQTLGRLVGSLNAVNTSFDLMGFKVLGASLASADAASEFIDAFGGIEAYLQTSNSFYQNYFSEAERTAKQVALLTEQFVALGFTLPTSRQGLRDLVMQQIALGTEALPTVAALLKLEGAFASVVPAIDAVADAATAAAAQAEVQRQQNAAIAAERSDRLRIERETAQAAKAATDELVKLNQENFKLAILAGNVSAALTALGTPGPKFSDFQGGGGFNAAGYNFANLSFQRDETERVLTATRNQNPFEVADYFGVIAKLEQSIASLTTNLESGEFTGGVSTLEMAAQQAFGDFLSPEQIQAAADGLTSFSNVLAIVTGTAQQGAIGADQALRVLEGSYTGVAKQSEAYARGLDIIGQSVGVSTGNLQDIQVAIQAGLAYFNSGEYYQVIAQEQLRVQVQFTSRAFAALTERASAFNAEADNLDTSFDVLDGFIGRLKSVQDAFANAAGDRAAEAGLISDAARRIGEIITTPVAEAAKNALTDLPSFAGLETGVLRDLSLLLKDLGQFDNAGLEKTFIRVSDALASGSVTAAQYADLIAYTESVYLGTATALETVGDSAAKAADILREREGLEVRLLQLQGNTAELRRRELEALDPSNRAYQQYIWMVEEAMKVADAFDSVRQAARSLSSQLLLNEGTNAFGQQSAVAEASRQYRETLAGAFEGDADAASALAGVTQTYLDLQRQTASTELEYRRAFATTLADLDRLQKAQAVGQATGLLPEASALPLATPTPVVLPSVPATYSLNNPAGTPSSDELRAMQAELVALRQLVTRLLAATESNLPAVAEHTAATANVLRRVTRNGNALVTTTE